MGAVRSGDSTRTNVDPEACPKESPVHEVEEIRAFLGVDSLAYLSMERMLSCVNGHDASYCTACFSGEYSIPIDASFQKDIFERNQLTFFDAPRPGAVPVPEQKELLGKTYGVRICYSAPPAGPRSAALTQP